MKDKFDWDIYEEVPPPMFQIDWFVIIGSVIVAGLIASIVL